MSYILKKQYLFEQNIAFLRKIKNSKKSHSRVHFAWLWDFLSGGGEGSRTPVRKRVRTTFYEFSLLFEFGMRRTTNKPPHAIAEMIQFVLSASYKEWTAHRRPVRGRSTPREDGRLIRQQLIQFY